MMDNSHKAICYDSDSNLDADGILRSVPKLLNLEMLLQPFEEEFHQLSFLVQFCNFKGCEMLGIGEESELTFFFLIIVSYKSK